MKQTCAAESVQLQFQPQTSPSTRRPLTSRFVTQVRHDQHCCPNDDVDHRPTCACGRCNNRITQGLRRQRRGRKREGPWYVPELKPTISANCPNYDDAAYANTKKETRASQPTTVVQGRSTVDPTRQRSTRARRCWACGNPVADHDSTTCPLNWTHCANAYGPTPRT